MSNISHLIISHKEFEIGYWLKLIDFEDGWLRKTVWNTILHSCTQRSVRVQDEHKYNVTDQKFVMNRERDGSDR